MEPNHETTPESSIPGGPERATPGSLAPEQSPYQRTPEQAPERQESREQVTGAGAGENAVALPSPIAPSPVAPPIVDDAAADQAKNPLTNDNPLAADDIDVIEKEWVDRAKKILQDTKDDPYQKEHDVSHLQADYLQKRFGVQVKLPQG